MDKFDGAARIYKKTPNILEKPLNKGRNEVRNSFDLRFEPATIRPVDFGFVPCSSNCTRLNWFKYVIFRNLYQFPSIL